MRPRPTTRRDLRPARWRVAWALCLGCVALVQAGCAGALRVVRGGGDERRCTLLMTNDSEAHFDGARLGIDPPQYLGTISRIAARKRALLADRPGGVLLISAGDVLQGRYMDRVDKDRARAAKEAWLVYDAAGYDLGTLGNHEFDAGPEVLKQALLGLRRYRLVVSNLARDSPTLDNRDGKLWDEHVVRECGGIRVGFLGLLTPQTRTISQFGDTRFSDPDDPVAPAARRAIARLRGLGAEAIVAITHLGLEHDVELARSVPDIDVILGGHSHTLMKTWRRVGRTTIVQSGERFSHLGQLELVLGVAGGVDSERSSWRVQPIDDSLPQDATIAARVEALRADFAKEVVVGTRSVPWELRGPGRRVYGRRVARALWRYAGARNAEGKPIDGAMINAGGLRTGTTYPPGPVTNFEIKAIHPFGNRLVIVALSGEALRDVLEHACSDGRRGAAGERLEAYGVRFRCQASNPHVEYRLEQGRPHAIVRRGQRVIEAMVGDRPLQPDGQYRVVVNDYLAQGGSGFAVLSWNPRTCIQGTAFEADGCRGELTEAEIVELAVQDGSFDAPVAE